MSKEWETYTQGGRKRLRRRPVRYHADTTTTAAAPPRMVEMPEDADDGTGAYDEMTKAELIAEAESRGLDTSGNKPDILARLEADDQ